MKAGKGKGAGGGREGAEESCKGKFKGRKERLELEWKEMLEAYAHQVAQWEETCKKLREQHVLVKDLPKKPKWLLKPKLKEVDNDDWVGDDEDDSDGDGDGDGDW